MARRTKSKRGRCTYCGAKRIVTDDHVPPKNIFLPPRPSNLVTVPACRPCHGATSADDEYFRTCLCLKRECGNHPDARGNWPAIFRGLARPEGFKRAFLSSTFTVRQFTPSGLYAGNELGFNVDLGRLFRVVERTIRGLYFHETGNRISSKYGVQIHCEDSLRGTSKRDLDELHETIISPLANMPATVIGANVFWYRFGLTTQPPVSAWALTFYGAVSFLGLVAAKTLDPAPNGLTPRTVGSSEN
jgi:hypothetical protein